MQPPEPVVGEIGELGPDNADDWFSALVAVSSTGRPGKILVKHIILAWITQFEVEIINVIVRQFLKQQFLIVIT